MKIVISMPTGSGKTYTCSSSIVKKFVLYLFIDLNNKYKT